MDFKNLSLREKVYKTMILNFAVMDTEGTLKEFFEKYPVSGMYFSKGPIEGLIEMEEGESVTKTEFMARCRKASKHPLVFCADGANIGDNGVQPLTQITMGATNSEELAYNYGKCLGMQMNYNDVDWLLGPCVDLACSRAFSSSSGLPISDDAEFAAKMFAKVVEGLQSQNVAATVKHFPGVGTHHVNFHITSGHNVFPFDKWMETYGRVYEEVFKAGSMSVMTSHLTLKSFSDKSDFGDTPIATYSKDLTIGLLKEKLGFDGVVVTDALTMGGKAYGNQVEETVAAFACGADFLLWPPLEAGERIIEELEKGNIPMSRLDDAIKRIERFYERLGIDDNGRKFPEPDPEYVDNTFIDIVKKSVTMVKNNVGNLPIDKSKKNILVDVITPEGKMVGWKKNQSSVEHFADILRQEGFNVDIKLNYTQFWEKKMKAQLENYDYVICMLDSPFQIDVFHECFNSAWTVHLIDDSKKILLNFATPYFLDDYYPHEQTVVQLYGGISELNVEAAADAILGKIEMEGKLPYKLNL